MDYRCAGGGDNNHVLVLCRLSGLFALITYLSVQLHEIGHWSVASLMGFRIILGFNRWQIISEAGADQKLLILVAGQAINIILITAGFFTISFDKRVFLRNIAIFAIISNSLILLISNLAGLLTGRPGDSGWIASYIGFPQAIVKLPLVAGSGFALIAGYRKADREMKRIGWVVALMVVFVAVMAVVVLLDKIVWVNYKQGEVFLPVGGISLITIITDISAFTVFVMLLCRRIFFSL